MKINEKITKSFNTVDGCEHFKNKSAAVTLNKHCHWS